MTGSAHRRPCRNCAPGCFLVPAGPLQADLVQPPVAHARVHRRERPQLVPHLLGGRVAPVVAQPRGQLADDLDVVARLSRRVERAAHALDAPLAVRDGPFGLAPARRGGQHDVGELGGAGEEDVLHDEVVEPLEQVQRVHRVGLRLRRILADDVQRLQLAALHRLEHLRQVPAVARLDRHAPGLLVLGARRVVALDVLEARQLVRDRAHVAAALHVVLAAQRVEARAVAADVAGQQRQVDQAEDVVDRVVMLGDAERPADHRAVGVRVGVRRLADQIGGHAGLALAPLERPRLDARRVVRRSRSSRGR